MGTKDDGDGDGFRDCWYGDARSRVSGDSKHLGRCTLTSPVCVVVFAGSPNSMLN